MTRYLDKSLQALPSDMRDNQGSDFDIENLWCRLGWLKYPGPTSKEATSASVPKEFLNFPLSQGNLDHSQGKWFAPGELLPAGFVVTAHPEGHTAPQDGHLMSDKAGDPDPR